MQMESSAMREASGEHEGSRNAMQEMVDALLERSQEMPLNADDQDISSSQMVI